MQQYHGQQPDSHFRDEQPDAFDRAYGVAQGFPHFLPGKNPYIDEAAKKQGLPLEALKGGAATMYPEYREKLKGYPLPKTASN